MPKSTNYQITTTLAVDGEKKFKAAMDDANRSMKVWDADLRAVQAEFTATGDKQKYLADRTELLGSKLHQQEAIVEALNNAVRESREMFGDAAKETDTYRIRLSNATAKMYDLRREAEQANRDLEDLGRDSEKIGRQIENGIGDAAEETADKLDGMFAKVAQDVNALKSSAAIQIGAEVGSFVLNAVQSVTSFVEENQDLNRQMAIAKYNIDKYDFDWSKSLELVTRAAAITGNQEGALEALNNLASTQVTNEELITAAMEGLLGVFITTGGSLSVESLAEDLRASVISKKPTGTYAEVLEELIQGIVIDDVEKALKATASAEEALQVATAYLTKAGYQTTTETFETQNAELLEGIRKRQELALAWADLATELQPTINDIISGATSLVEGLNKVVDIMGGFSFTQEDLDKLNNDIENFYTDPANADSFARKWADFWGITPEKYKNSTQSESTYQPGSFEKSLAERSLMEWIFPSAGAETMPTAQLQEYGFTAAQEIANGMMQAQQGDSAITAAVTTALYDLNSQVTLDNARTSGKNLMTEFGNGIAAGVEIPLANVRNMVNQINAILAQIATPAYGLGWSGISGGNIYLYNQQQSNARAVSKTIGSGVMRTTLSKK